MAAHVDILEQRDSLKRPLVFSVAAHAALFSSIALYTSLGARRGAFQWGNPRALGGSSVGITAVRQIPLPARSGAANPLANDTESRVPQPPKPEVKPARKAPEPEAIAIRGRSKAREEPRPRPRPQATQSYRASPDRPNQLYSGVGQALSSPMFSQQTGTGGVGMGTGGAFGTRFGYYRDLLERAVAQKWRTEDVDPRLQTAPPVIVTFEILRTGQIHGVRILQGSGNYTLDQSAKRAIVEASPFPPLPQGYERDTAQIEFWFLLKR